MRYTKENKLMRENFVKYMTQVVTRLPKCAAGGIAQEPIFKRLIVFLAEHAPSKMKPVLAKGSETITTVMKRVREDNIEEEKRGDSYKGRKRLKINRDSPYADHILGGCKKDCMKINNLLIDSGDEHVESYEAARKVWTATETNSRLRKPETVRDGGQCKAENEKTDYDIPLCTATARGMSCVLNKERDDTTADQPEQLPASTGLSEPAFESIANLNLSRAGSTSPKDTTNVPDTPSYALKVDAGVSQMDDASEIHHETGLACGDPYVRALICTAFFEEHSGYRGTPQSILDAVLDACVKLDPLIVKYELIDHLRDCLCQSNAEGCSIPTTSEREDPHQIFDTLMRNESHDINTRIHRVYDQLNFYTAVNRKVVEGDEIRQSRMLDKLAQEKADNSPKQLRKKTVEKYKREYHMGRRWLEVVESFEGTGVALVFIVAGITPGEISHEWREVQRDFLKFLSKYLGSVKRIVAALGNDGLRNYYQQGFLSKEQINALEATEIFSAHGAETEDDNDSEDSDDSGSDSEKE